MIDLYYAPTPNGKKITIMLEECELDYRVMPVNITKGDQFTPEFLAISPNGKIPTIVDPQGLSGAQQSVFESGAILLYLAEKTDSFLPREPGSRYEVIQWLMFQMGGFGPMIGQAHHFLRYAPEKIEYGIQRYHRETQRLYGVINDRLAVSSYLANTYSIADMAVFPWVAAKSHHQIDLADYPHVQRWYDQIKERPAVRKGMDVLQDQVPASFDEEAQRILFGNSNAT